MQQHEGIKTAWSSMPSFTFQGLSLQRPVKDNTEQNPSSISAILPHSIFLLLDIFKIYLDWKWGFKMKLRFLQLVSA